MPYVQTFVRVCALQGRWQVCVAYNDLPLVGKWLSYFIIHVIRVF